ncbi:MAG: O-antigen ligase family protein [Bacteroidales bacterium]|nr:O-antigen ligase family protein [Bacteroidales bacterium]
MMKWYDKLQYGAMLLMAAAMPIGWRYGLWTAAFLGLVTVVKMVAQRRLGNPALTKPLRWAMAGAVVYWLVLTLSLLWTNDMAEGAEVLYLKAVLLIFPVSFLLSDTSYLTRSHLRGVGYALLIGVVGAFLYFLVKAGIGALKGVSFVSFQNSFYASYAQENRGVYHHAYIALYAVVAMVFVYHELSSRWKEHKVWSRIVLIVALLLLIGYTVLVNSRAGMLAMALTALACVVHLALTRRSWKLGVGVALLVAGGMVAVTQLMPGYVDRITSTVVNVEDDARTSINRENFRTAMQSPVVGYGVGDYRAVQQQQYAQDGHESWTFNAHNQYMESLLAAGIPGLLALLCFLVMPLCLAMKRRSRYAFPLVAAMGVVMFNLLFESMLERQMGLQFIGYLYAIMVLIMSVEENKFAQSSKS